MPVYPVGVIVRKSGGSERQLIPHIETFPEMIEVLKKKKMFGTGKTFSIITQEGKKTTPLSFYRLNLFFKRDTFVNQPRKLYVS